MITQQKTKQSVHIKIKVDPLDIKTFRDPNGLGRKRFCLQLPVDEIANAKIEFGPNPRNQNLDTKVAKAIEDTLISQPGKFLYANKGILINAQHAEYDNKSQFLSLRLERDTENPWGESDGGNIDGGHTNAIILEKIKDGWQNPTNPKYRQYVSIEILTGIPHDELAFIAGARNTTMQVKDLALAVLNDELDWLIKLFDKEGFNDHIAWRQNAPRTEWSGEDVIAYLSLLNAALKDKVRCYVGAGRIITELKKRPSEPQNEMMEGLRKTAPVAVEWMRFIDYVHKSLKPWYASYKSEVSEKQSRFRQLAAVTPMDDGHSLVFLSETIDYRVVKSWLMPLVHAFAPVIKHEPKQPMLWRKIADQIGPRLMENICEHTENENNNLNALGKSRPAWTSCVALVEAEYYKMKFREDRLIQTDLIGE